MDVYYVTAVDGDGATTTTTHQTRGAAEKAFADENPHLVSHEILGVVMDQQETSGTIRPVKVMSIKSSGDVLINSIKDLRQRGYSPLQTT